MLMRDAMFWSFALAALKSAEAATPVPADSGPAGKGVHGWPARERARSASDRVKGLGIGSASIAGLAVLAAGLAGCSSISVPASPTDHLRAAQLPVYMAGQAVP